MLKLHNTLSDKIEEFKPLNGNTVTMYVCGPTVYDYPHLGHARCYITWDTVYRYLKFSGYDVKYCRNVTDVDDKILAKATAENSDAQTISSRYHKIFTEAMNTLNTLPPDFEPKATKTIGKMIKMVKILIEKGHAYEVDGDVFFRVKSYKDYGMLSKQPLDDLEAGARVDKDERKESPLDFALWKKDEKFGYPSPWGKGRPGWHIECSAMSEKYLGESIDIHAGGADLIFPHHENEIAQSVCAHEKPFVKYWLHNGFVTINKEKMSKSLKNFVTINALLENYDADTIRFFILTNHYRMPVEFNDEALHSAKAGFSRLQNVIDSLENIPDNIEPDTEFINKFKEAMDNDFNTSVALSVLFELATKINTAINETNNPGIEKYGKTLLILMNVLGFTCKKSLISEDKLSEKIKPLLSKFGLEETMPAYKAMDEIVKMRTDARTKKNWELSDKIRDEFNSVGITFKDGKDKSIWCEIN